MKRRGDILLNEEQLKGLRKRLEQKRLNAEDYELLGKMIRETKRLLRRRWWMALAKRMLLRMLAVKNLMRGCRGKSPLIPEERDENGC